MNIDKQVNSYSLGQIHSKQVETNAEKGAEGEADRPFFGTITYEQLMGAYMLMLQNRRSMSGHNDLHVEMPITLNGLGGRYFLSPLRNDMTVNHLRDRRSLSRVLSQCARRQHTYIIYI